MGSTAGTAPGPSVEVDEGDARAEGATSPDAAGPDAARPDAAGPGPGPGPGPASDGRRARRDRNRTSVVDALLSLYRDGNLDPSTDEIAARAGVSARSLFRYFDDVEDMTRTAIALQHAHVDPVVADEPPADAPFDQRVRRFVGQRIELYRAMAGVGVVARAREPFRPLIADELARMRRFLRARASRVFAPELAAIEELEGADAARAALDAVDTLCSFEAHRLIDATDDSDRPERAWTLAVTRVLAPAAPSAPSPTRPRASSSRRRRADEPST